MFDCTYALVERITLEYEVAALLVAIVRQKAKEINGFLQDEDRLREARKAAKQNRDKYVGYSSDQANSKYSELELLDILKVFIAHIMCCLTNYVCNKVNP